MVAMNTSSSAEGDKNKNYFNQMVDEAKFNVVRPRTKGVTEVRFIPEIAADGSILPGVLGVTPQGALDVSNARIYNVVVNNGLQNRFTGIVTPSDVDPLPADVALPFIGLWIRLKSRMKKIDSVPSALLPTLMKLLNEDDKGHTPCKRPDRLMFLQGIVLVENDKVLPKPALKQVIALSASAVSALNTLFKELHAKGIDPMSPDKGVTVKFSGVPPNPEDKRATPMFAAAVGRELTLKPDLCHKLWTPWDVGLRRYTMSELFQHMVRCFGREVVEYAFKEELLMHLPPAGAAAVAATPAPVRAAATPAATAPSAPAPAAPAMALDISDEDLSAPPTVVEEAPEAPVATPAPVAAKAAATAAPVVSTPAPVTASSLQASSEDDLEAQMRELLGDSDEE